MRMLDVFQNLRGASGIQLAMSQRNYDINMTFIAKRSRLKACANLHPHTFRSNNLEQASITNRSDRIWRRIHQVHGQMCIKKGNPNTLIFRPLERVASF